MTLIERYINAVIHYLPADIQQEVAMELRANILDMLSDDADEIEITKVLESMGNPSDLAMEYHPEKRYLIGPAIYTQYVEILKLVLSIVAIVLTIISCVSIIFNGEVISSPSIFVEIISKTLPMIAEGLLQATVVTTVVFMIIDRNKVLDGQSLFNKKKWTIEDLEEIRKPENKISKSEAVVGICFNIIFAILFIVNPNIMPIVVKYSANTTVIPIFNFMILKPYIPFIVVYFLVSAIFGIYKMVKGYWTKKMVIFNSIQTLLFIVLLLSMAFNTELISEASKMFVSSYFPNAWFRNSLWVGLAIVIGIDIWDTISTWRKASK